MPRDIHTIRAQKWQTDPWVAEWIDNSLQYCSTSKGKQELEEWAATVYGAQGARVKLQEIHRSPPARFVVRDPEELLYTRAAMELGSTSAAVRLYCDFTSANNLVHPERTKPAPQRRKGESSEHWLARRHAALIQGSKIPDMRWQECRAIALSQFDNTQDIIKLLRTDIQVVMEILLTRQRSTIPSQEILPRGEQYVFLRTVDDAFRSTVLLQMHSYAAWSLSAELFEEFARRGLTTPASIERAYKSDVSLLWQITAAMCSLDELVRYRLGHMAQTITYSEHFRPYFKRYRDLHGLAHIERNDTYIRWNEDTIDTFDRAIIDALATPGLNHINHVTLLHAVDTALHQDSSFVKRFSAEAFESIGDFAVAHEMMIAMHHSAFGQECTKQWLALQSRTDRATIVSRIGYLRSPPPLPSVNYYDVFGVASAVTKSEANQWQGESIAEVSVLFGPECKYGEAVSLEVLVNPLSFDAIWKRVDQQLWESARRCERPGEEGRIAKLFGLLDPNDPNRPTFLKAFAQAVKDEERPLETQNAVKSTPAPAKNPYAGTIPTAVPGTKDEAIVSGHAYAQSEPATAKAKTKGSAGDSAVQETEVKVETPDLDTFPDVLPQSYKLGRKVAKVFHRLLDGKYEPQDDKLDAPKKGQIRWNEFEKAMKRIGFTIIQTAGSSVRFDPPAKTARPITFHRPHPDSLLTPTMVKIVGTRLSRCYGWTMKTFEVGIND